MMITITRNLNEGEILVDSGRFKYNEQDLTDYDDEGRQITPSIIRSTLTDESTGVEIEVIDNPIELYKLYESLNELVEENDSLKSILNQKLEDDFELKDNIIMKMVKLRKVRKIVIEQYNGIKNNPYMPKIMKRSHLSVLKLIADVLEIELE